MLGFAYQTHSVLLAALCDNLPLEYELKYRTGVPIRRCQDSEHRIASNVTRNVLLFQRMKSPKGHNTQCWSNIVGNSVHKMPVVNKGIMFQHVYGSLRPRSLIELVC